MTNVATLNLEITDCLDCPFMRPDYGDIDDYTSIYCEFSSKLIGEYKTRWLLSGKSYIPVPNNCPLLSDE